MSVLHWFALAVVALSALHAAWTTLIAWRLRKATPRTISLALSLGACVALVVTAADVPLTLPVRWCTKSVPAGPGAEPFSERVRAALDSWAWVAWPCGRVAVQVVPADLEAPLAVGELVERAAAVRVSVDVTLSQELPRPGQPLRLALKDRPVMVPASTPIPLSYADRVIPRLVDTNGPVECRLDDRAPLSDRDLLQLLRQPAESAGDVAPDDRPPFGFHRLRCWPIGHPEAASAAYVQLVEAGVVFASSKQTLVERFKTCRSAGDKDPAECIGLELGSQDPFALQVPVAVDEQEIRGPASMLVLDRPQSPRSCQRARELLELGATVVVAMPDERFFDASCKQWFPIVAKKDAEHLVFDRTPRLTFVFDSEFEEGLDRSPSIVLHGDCQGQSFPTQWLERSDDAQRGAARKLCLGAAQSLPGVQCGTPGFVQRFDDASKSPVREFARPPGTPAESCKGSEGCARLERTDPVRAVFALADELSARKEAWENEVVVVFTHDHRPPDVLDSLKNFASRVRVVPIDDPYGISLSANSLGASNKYTKTVLPDVLAGENPRSVRLSAPERGPVSCVERSVPNVELDFSSLFAGEGQTRARFKVSEDATTRFPRKLPDEQPAPGEAPDRFGWWEQPTGDETMDRAAVELASTTMDAGFVERPLMLGSMTGRGHLLFLSYSPFETSAVRTTVVHREVLDGLRAIKDIYAATESFVGDVHGKVLAVEPRVDGALWITVVRDDLRNIDRGLRALTLTWSGGSIAAPLVDFAIERRSLTYAVPAAALESLRRCEPLELPEKDSPRVFACPPDHTSSARLMAAVDALAQLAFYTGGRLSSGADPEESADRAHTLHTRPLGLGMLALLFLTAWGRRAVRRLGGRLADRRLRDSVQMVQRRYDPPDAVVAAAGDWDGRATTWPRTGAFGGYRALEPGDRVSAVVLGDLLVRQLEGTQMLPRVTLRIEEAAPSVAVFVNLGASMRGPGSTANKARFAARIGHHIAAAAWKIGGEVSIHGVGVDGEPELVEAVCLNPGHEAIEDNLRARLRQRPTRDPTPWPRERPECGSVVYVSDFQLEDERALHAWLTELEGAGIRVAGVMLYSPREFTMIEGGRLAGSGIWADRTDWDPDDVFAAFSRRRDQIERSFDSATTGGLVVAATTFHQDDIELALASGRLLQILR